MARQSTVRADHGHHRRQAARAIAGAESDPRRLRAGTCFGPNSKFATKRADGTYEADNVYDATNLYSADEASVQAVLDEFDVGKQYPMWYDPLDPAHVVMVQGYSAWLYVSLLIPLSFMVIGGGRMIYALVHWNASEERAQRDRAAGRAAATCSKGPRANAIFPPCRPMPT